MENLDSTYFKKVISELKKVKQQENFKTDHQFKAELRSKLMERATNWKNPGQSNWADLFQKWKYALAVVPTLALLTLVAIKALDYKLDMKGGDYWPVVSDATVTKQLEDNLSTGDESQNKTSTIETFSAELALPPADILDNYLKQKSGVEEKSVEPVVDEEQLPGQNLAGKNQQISNQKIPETIQKEIDQIIKTGGENSPQPVLSSVVFSRPQTFNEIQAVTNQPAANGQVQGNQGNITEVSVSQIIRPEQSGRVEDTGRFETSGKLTTDIIEPEAVSPVIPLTDKPNVIDIKPLVNSSLTYFDGAGLVLDKARIHYSGKDLDLVSTIVVKEFEARNGNLSSDYYFEVDRLDENTLKVSLYEFGRIKKIIIMKLFNGQYQTVTEFDY